MMQNLAQQDIQGILCFLQHLYMPCEVAAFGRRVVSLLPQVVPSELTLFSTINYQNREVNSTASCKSVSLDAFRQIIYHHFNEHPHIAYLMKTGDSRTYKISDFVSKRELHSLEGVYHQYLHPLGLQDQMTVILSDTQPSLIGSGVAHQGQVTVGIGLHRNHWDFSERDRLILDLLRPHLHQAYQQAKVFTQMQQTLAQLNQAFEQAGTIILSADGQVKLMPQSAWRLLTHYFQPAWMGSDRLPETLQQWVNHQISLQTPNNDISSPGFPLRVEQNGKRLIIRLIANSVNEQHVLILEEQQLRTFSIASLELLGLTKREAEVLLWVAKDKSNPEIATILGCRTETVKKHLDHVYAKWGVKSRLAAVTYAMEQLGMINH